MYESQERITKEGREEAAQEKVMFGVQRGKEQRIEEGRQKKRECFWGVKIGKTNYLKKMENWCG